MKNIRLSEKQKIYLLGAGVLVAVLVVAVSSARTWLPNVSRAGREALGRAFGMTAAQAAGASDTVLNAFLASEIEEKAKTLGLWAVALILLRASWMAGGLLAFAPMLVGVAFVLAVRHLGRWPWEQDPCLPSVTGGELDAVHLALCYESGGTPGQSSGWDTAGSVFG